MNKNAAFTVIAQNYVGYGIVLAESMQKSNPDVDFYIYFADGVSEEIAALLVQRKIKFVDAPRFFFPWHLSMTLQNIVLQSSHLSYHSCLHRVMPLQLILTLIFMFIKVYRSLFLVISMIGLLLF